MKNILKEFFKRNPDEASSIGINKKQRIELEKSFQEWFEEDKLSMVSGIAMDYVSGLKKPRVEMIVTSKSCWVKSK